MAISEQVVQLRREAPEDPTRAVRDAYARLRRAYEADPYPSAQTRESWLDRLLRILQKERDSIVDAVRADYGARSAIETLTADVLTTAESIRHSRKHLRGWMQRRSVSPQWYMRPGRAFVEPQPLGVVGIIAPWNYPVNLAIAPLAAALSAGNRVIIKPSEFTPNTADLLIKLLGEVFSPDEVAVVTGGPDVAKAITQLPLDHILFTGSTQVGKHVAKAAAENLTPVTLELGGKSPAVMHPSYDIAKFAERIAAGKTFNAGQTCIAPDYVMVPKGTEQTFVDVYTTAVRKLAEVPGAEQTAVIHDRALKRLENHLDDAQAKGAKVVFTTPHQKGERGMTTALVLGVNDSMTVMQEEIFGPVLPVMTYDSLEDAWQYVREHDRPLALYYFDDNSERVNQVLRKTISGGVCINDTLMHFAQDELPFGGVGMSGIGQYHGTQGFDRMSHLKSVFVQSDLNMTPKLLGLPAAAMRRALDVLIGGSKRRPGE